MTTAMVTANENPADSVRLNQLLAQIGVASRRACDALIAAGRVRVDGRIVRELGVRVVPGVNRIDVDGKRVGRPQTRVVLILHKPRGVVSTVTDPQGRPTVVSLCRGVARTQRLFPVGRLDVNTTGALLVTNDGFLCYRLTHPRFGIPRVYQVRVRGRADDTQMRRLERMVADPGPAPARGTGGKRRDAVRSSVELVTRLEKEAVLRVTLREGRNRQVRNMCEAVGLRIVSLKRVSFGPISLWKLPVGAVRPLTRRELEKLDRLAGGNNHGH
jgi:23S rRNA pseudouridine2605 synthase